MCMMLYIPFFSSIFHTGWKNNICSYKSCLARLLLVRIFLPYLKRTNGMGMKAMARKPRREDAQPTPSLLYMAEANSGCKGMLDQEWKDKLGGWTYETTTKGRSNEIVTSQYTSGILWVCITEVVQDRVEE